MRRSRATGGPDRAWLISLAVLAVAAFNFPLLILWDKPVTVLGMPLLGVAIFVIWVALIGGLIWVSEAAPKAPPAPPDASLPDPPPRRED